MADLDHDQDGAHAYEQMLSATLKGLNPADIEKIEATCRSPKGNKLKAYYLTDLLSAPFYYGQGDFR